MSAIDKVKEFIVKEARGIKTIGKEYGDVVDQIQKHLDLYKQTKGTPAEKQHIQQLKQLNDKKKALAAELDQKVSGLYKDAELKVDEMNTSAAAGPYNTPFAFSGKDSEAKKGKKQADLTGYTVVKESFINEDIDSLYLAAILVVQAAALGGNIGALAANYTSGDNLGPIDSIKKWWKDRKDDKAIKSIISKIKSDPEMIAFFKMSQNQQKGKFRKLIASKLSGEELQYLNRINKSDLQENRWRDIKNEETAPINKLKQKMPNHVKSWAKYVAQHEDGEWWFYDDTPKLVPGVGWKSYNSDGHQWSSDVKTNSKNWEKSSQKLNENRWRDIKNEEAPATTKVNKGIANINHQLAEIEKFLGWYGKLKAENGVNNGNFWKRTNNHIYTIKERLLNLERQVRKISE